MKRSIFTLSCLVFSIAIFCLIWLWPTNPSHIKQISQSGDSAYAKDIKMAGYLLDSEKDEENPMFLEFKTYQNKGIVPYQSFTQNRPVMSAREEILTQFPIWNRPQQLGYLKLVESEDMSLWFNNIRFSSDGRLNYTLINKDQPSYKNLSYSLKNWTAKSGYFESLSYTLTDDGLKLLLSLYNSVATEEFNYFDKFVLLTLDPKTGQVKEEISLEGQNNHDYYPNLELSASYQPAYHIIQSYPNASYNENIYSAENYRHAGAHIQIYDPNFKLVGEFNAEDYQADTFLIWSKEDKIFFLSGKGVSQSGPNSLTSMGQGVKLSLYEYDLDKQKAHKISDLSDVIKSLQVYQGNIHYVTSHEENETDKKDQLVLDPDLNQVVYQATWQAVHPDHPIQILNMDPKSY